ncbi:MAG: ATP-binding protein [Candidatus Scalinduaceae bacterium]
MKLGIRTKIITLFLITGIVPFAVTGILIHRAASTSLKKQAFDQLVSIREMKKKQIENYFSTIRKQIHTLSEDKMIVDAMKGFKDALKDFRKENDISDSQLEEYRSALKTYYAGDFTEEYKRRNNGRIPDVESYFNQLDDDSIALQYFYIKANHNRLGEKHRLDFADDKSTYSKLHAKYHLIIRDYLEHFGYYDIFLVDPDSGDIVYTVFKELDFTTSLKDGPYAGSNFGRVFREANNSDEPHYVKLVDFEPYPPSYEDAASFIASPIFDGSEKVGVLLFQMPIDRINLVMTNNNDWKSVGLGESGETYLIGNDFTMRNQSRSLIEDKESYFTQVKMLGMNQELLDTIKAKDSTILLQKVETKGTRAAISGETNVEIFPDYRDVPVLSAYAPLDIEDVKWAIMSEIDEQEALSPVITLTNQVFKIVAVTAVIVIATITVFLSARITRPIRKLVEGTRRIAKGDLAFSIETKARDEIGYLATSFNDMAAQLGESKKRLQDYTLNLEKKVEDKTSELRKEKEYTESLIETAQDAIICIDEDGVISVWNKLAENIFGYSKGEIIGKPITTIIPERYRKQHQGGLKRFLKSGESKIIGKTVEVSGKTKEGVIIPIELSLSFQRTKDEQYSFTAIIRDITFKKEAERKLIEKAKELERANRELEDFIYIVSHDLKEPLFAIEGYMSRLSRAYKNAFDDKGKLYINRIKVNIKNMSQKIYEIMEVVKVGRVIYNFENNDIEVIIKDVVNSLEGRVKKNKINVLIEDNLPTVFCDRERLKDVFSNLVTNAIKFMGKDGKRHIKVGCDKDGDCYRFFVEDTGIGIPAKYQERIFKIFRRLNDIETEGTGVGLAIVKKIVELHDGKIWVESPVNEGKGSRFCFTLPAMKESCD